MHRSGDRSGAVLGMYFRGKSGSCCKLPWGRPSFFVVCRLRSSLTRRVKLRSSWNSLRTNGIKAILSSQLPILGSISGGDARRAAFRRRGVRRRTVGCRSNGSRLSQEFARTSQAATRNCGGTVEKRTHAFDSMTRVNLRQARAANCAHEREDGTRARPEDCEPGASDRSRDSASARYEP